MTSRHRMGVVLCGFILGISASARAAPDPVGIPECDTYLTRFEACIQKAAPKARPEMQSSLKKRHDEWKQGAGSDRGLDKLRRHCQEAVDELASDPTCA